MKLNIRWLLEENHELKGFTCLAGKKGINHPICSINIMDNPDTVPWLKKDELILSTGYILSSTDIYKNIIQNLYDKGCAGLGIKMNRYMDNLPSEMLEQANQLGFTIFSIPFSSTMEQIVNLIYRQIFNNEMSESERIMNIYKSITEATLKRHNVLPVLEQISLAIKNPVFLTTPGFEIIDYYLPLESSLNFPFSYSKDGEHLFSEVDIIFLQNEYLTNPLPVRKYEILSSDIIHHYIIFAIVQQKKLLGYLICLEETSSFSSFEYELISNLQSILCITMIKTSILSDGQQIDKTTFFNELLSGKLKTDQEIEPLCIQYGFNFSSPRICATLRINEVTTSRQRTFIRKINTFIHEILIKSDIEFTTTIYEGDFILFFFLNSTNTVKQLEDIQNYFNKLLDKLKLENFSSFLAIGSCMHGASTICTSYLQSVRALELGKKLHLNEHFFSYEKDKIFHILSANFTTSQLIDYYTNVLKPLDDYDNLNKTNLSETLKKYFNCEQNIAKSAKQLYIHRNTMIYRMEQIQKIITFDNKNPDQVYLLQTAFYIKKLLSL